MTKELHDLRAEHEKVKQKKRRSKHQITPNEGPSIQEARDLIAQRNEQLNQEGSSSSEPSISNLDTLIPQKRAPPRCSDCHTLGHIRTRCPNR
jgi:hypothetical protein